MDGFMENPSRNKNDLELPPLPHGNRKYLVFQLTQAHSLWLSPPNSSQVAQKFHDSSNDPKKILGKPPKELTCSYYIPMIFPWFSHDFPMIFPWFVFSSWWKMMKTAPTSRCSSSSIMASALRRWSTLWFRSWSTLWFRSEIWDV